MPTRRGRRAGSKSPDGPRVEIAVGLGNRLSGRINALGEHLVQFDIGTRFLFDILTEIAAHPRSGRTRVRTRFEDVPVPFEILISQQFIDTVLHNPIVAKHFNTRGWKFKEVTFDGGHIRLHVERHLRATRRQPRIVSAEVVVRADCERKILILHLARSSLPHGAWKPRTGEFVRTQGPDLFIDLSRADYLDLDSDRGSLRLRIGLRMRHMFAWMHMYD